MWFEVAYVIAALIIFLAGTGLAWAIRDDKGYLSGKDLFWLVVLTPAFALTPWLNFLIAVVLIIGFLTLGVDELERFELFRKK